MTMNALRYSVEWIDEVANAAPEERATVADLKLFLGGQNVTMHLREDKAFDYITVSLYPLVEGLVHDWWSIFGDRDHQFSLLKYRSGFALPDIRLQFDGSIFEISAVQRIYRNPNVRFWVGPSENFSRTEAEANLIAFVTPVLERLASQKIVDTSAALRWARIIESLKDKEESAFCECAGALGKDPYAVDVSVSDLIDDASRLFGSEPLNEFLAGSKKFSAVALLDWIRKAESRSTGKSTVYELKTIASEVTPMAPALGHERAWSLGYRRARAVKRFLNISQGTRFKSLKAISRQFGASHSFEVAARIDGIRALRSDHNGVVSIHLRDHGTSAEAESAERFSFARAVGDVVCFPEPARSVVNELRFASRQAAGRAFAAEFLAPIEEIQSMLADSHDVVTIAEEFGVSTVLVDHQIENASRIVESLDAKVPVVDNH